MGRVLPSRTENCGKVSLPSIAGIPHLEHKGLWEECSHCRHRGLEGEGHQISGEVFLTPVLENGGQQHCPVPGTEGMGRSISPFREEASVGIP